MVSCVQWTLNNLRLAMCAQRRACLQINILFISIYPKQSSFSTKESGGALSSYKMSDRSPKIPERSTLGFIFACKLSTKICAVLRYTQIHTRDFDWISMRPFFLLKNPCHFVRLASDFTSAPPVLRGCSGCLWGLSGTLSLYLPLTQRRETNKRLCVQPVAHAPLHLWFYIS